MDKNAIKKYAVWARRELISRVTQRALKYGIEEKNIVDEDADSIHGTLLTDDEKAERKALIAKIKENGFEQVMEEVAYTWFNRFSALRFMEVNGYLPTHVRVFTDDENNFKPQILTEAIHLELDGLDMDKVYAYKEKNDDDELFKYLIITHCNALNKILPGMFQKIADYTELLFPDNLLREGSVVEQMIAMIPEDDWKDAVQIIGWLYQYYNIDTFNAIYDGDMSRKKIEKNLLPAATQMFTPDWVVRYMIENSLGYLWLEGHPNEKLKSNWKYYLDETKQESDVQIQLNKICEEYKTIKPEDIRCIDPCMGSGHILVYMFDVLMQIYETYGYNQREAVASIVENNLYGLDIDERAAQLAYFAIMMKARQHDHRFFSHSVQPHVYAIRESNHLDKFAIEYFCNKNAKLESDMQKLITEMYDAREYGSIINVSNVNFASLFARFNEIKSEINIYREQVLNELMPFVQVAQTMALQYDVAVTNPPYLNSSRMSHKLNEYIRSNFAGARFDLCMVMYEAIAKYYVKPNRILALVTTTSWMFISSFEEVRNYVVKNLDFKSLVDFGTELFDGKIGHLPITAWINIKGHYGRKFYAIRLVDYCYGKRDEKAQAFFDKENYYITDERWFENIEGNPLCYWINGAQIEAFKNNPSFVTVSPPRTGMMTTNNNLFLREWYEVTFDNISLTSESIEESIKSQKKWFPYNKGGNFQKWYGNRNLVVNWENAGRDIAASGMTSFRGKDFYFKEGLTWTIFGYDNFAVRYSPVGSIFDIGGTSTFPPKRLLYYILGYLNSKVASDFITLINPTVNIQNGDVKRLPIIIADNEAITFVTKIVIENVNIVKHDYDSSELSWDFVRHPLAISIENQSLENAYCDYVQCVSSAFNTLRSNEEQINICFAKLYGVEEITKISVDDKKVSIHIKNKQELITELISYAVGCMFGRYSLDTDGLAYAGGKWDASKYKTYPADTDNIIPICDDEYFDDDIVGRFVKFVEVVYGKDTLEENLKFIANALGGKGSPRDVIRYYFLNDFYANHCKIYQKRPIYWLFDSGKKNGFKALIYMHRYQPDTLARMRTDYVHEQQERYRTAITHIEQRLSDASTAERVKLNKQLEKLKGQADEIRVYEEKIHHLADQMIKIDLDDGVKHNYEIFKDVLAKIK